MIPAQLPPSYPNPAGTGRLCKAPRPRGSDPIPYVREARRSEGAAVYLRLVITRRDEDSSRKQGVFTPAYALLDGRTLPEAEHERLADLVAWFER